MQVEFPGKHNLQPPCRDCPSHSASSLVSPFDCIQQEIPDMAKLKTSAVDTIRMEALFSVMSRNVLDTGFSSSLHLKRKWSSLSSHLRKIN
ncbi:hypothetical protein TNCV_2561831 [Trichonephila clavipes]|uniref:Uncharacterized protein n=1 Tax=Trichonephila clavipes TaxID=2585209 RepID=A0A8X6R6P7_TRICX|nr:hypothetical protein TNCV_2561831 [Trichonephila clavipes]